MSASPATVPARRAPSPARRHATPARKPAPAKPTPRPKRRPSQGRRPSTRTVRLVRAAPKRRRRTAPFLVLSSLLIGGLVVGIVTLQALVSQTSFRMQDLQVHAKALQQRYGEQTLTVARLSAPERIAAAAHHAGLVLPDPSQVYTLHVRGAGAAPGHAPRSTSSSASGNGAPAGSSLKAILGTDP